MKDAGLTQGTEVWLYFQATEHKPSLFHSWNTSHVALASTPAIPSTVILPLNENLIKSLMPSTQED